ncbi:MAG: hypothetical protein KatS3mg124_1698 [Porticoccaceae bacterium]|nr:MAG: hypothetical protein KatS3mg124_1698 [Porticoccaceae bacterium]
MRAREDEIRAIARELVAGLADRGRCNFTTDYAEVLPIRIFLGLMDLPLADAPRLKSWADALIRPGGDLSFAAAMERLFAYLAPHVDARRGRGGEDLLSRLLDTSPEGRPLDREECLKLAVQVLIAGLDTVVNFLGFVFLHLARDAALRRELAADPARIPAAVEEFLRRYPLVTIGREVREDLEIDGVLLRAGEMVATPTPLAALDDTFNPRPAEFDPHRGARRSLTFGAGHHVCPGRFLTRAEVRITLEEWLRRIPDFWLPQGAEIRFRGGIVGVVEQLPLEWAH